MSRALNITTGLFVDGDLVQLLGEEFRDWRARGLTQVDGWEINPTPERVSAVRQSIYESPDAVAARAAAVTAAIEDAKAAAKRQTSSGLEPSHLVERAIVGLLIDQINVLRTKVGLATVTAAQAKAALDAKIQSLTGG